MLKEYNCHIEETTRHHKIVDSEGNTVITFAIKHQKGSPKQVKINYVNDFLNEINR